MESHDETGVETGQTLGHHRLESRLGRGGMGAVFTAYDTQLDRRVALKVLPPEFAESPERLRRFDREAKALARLNHPNIVTVYSVDTAGEIPYLTMELVEGSPLSASIPRRGLSLERFFELAVPLADSLAAAHEQGIIHRDLKPGNIMVDGAGRPKVLDFGLAKTLVAEGADEVDSIAVTVAAETATGAVLGTVGYMSPEQVRGEKVDPRSDIFSLGLVLYEMATGRRPFEAPTSPEQMSAILRDDPVPAEEVRPELPHHLSRILRRCLEKDPDRRYQSAKDLRNELDDLASELATRSVLEGHEDDEDGETFGRRTYARLVAGAILALIVAIFVAYLYVKRGVEGPPTAAGPEIRSVAVLPFDNLMRDPEQDYFVEGMHEALITDLSKIGALRVISRTSAMRYAGSEKSLPEIADELDVDALIEGSVLRADGQVRITAQLIDGETDQHLWAQRYDRELESVLALLSEVAQAIAQEIEVTMTAEQQHRLTTSADLTPEVQDLLLRGQYHFNKAEVQEFRQALEYFSRVVELDPSFARGWGYLASTYLVHGFFGMGPRDEMVAQARIAARRALELDPLSGAAHGVLGTIALLFDWDWATAKRELELGIELEPTEVMAYHSYADYLGVMGDCEGSLAQVKRGLRHDPVGPWANLFVVAHATFCGKFEEALEAGQRSLGLGISGVAYFVGLAHWLQADYEEALDRWREGFGSDSSWYMAVEQGYREAGPEGAMLAAAEQEAGLPASRVNPFQVAAYYAAAGHTDEAFEWLERAFDERTPQLLHLTFHPLLDPIRDDPRFDDLLRRIGIPE